MRNSACTIHRCLLMWRAGVIENLRCGARQLDHDVLLLLTTHSTAGKAAYSTAQRSTPAHAFCGTYLLMTAWPATLRDRPVVCVWALLDAHVMSVEQPDRFCHCRRLPACSACIHSQRWRSCHLPPACSSMCAIPCMNPLPV